jgi:hypothetical protein
VTAIFLVTIGLPVAALALAPLLLPWRRHLQWLVATNWLPDLWTGAMPSDLWMDEVQVLSPPRGDVVWITGRGGERSALSLVRLEAADRSQLEAWANAGTPLLRVVYPDGGTSLHHVSECVVFAAPKALSTLRRA